MRNFQYLLGQINPGMSSDTLRQISYALGECMVSRNTEVLSQFYDCLRQTRRYLDDESVLRQPIAVLATMLDGYFATREPIERLEHLEHEVSQTPEWRALLNVLAKAQDDVPLPTICEQLHATTTNKAPDTSAEENPVPSLLLYQELVIQELNELQVRELLEYTTDQAGVRAYHLTRLGHDLCAKCQIG